MTFTTSYNQAVRSRGCDIREFFSWADFPLHFHPETLKGARSRSTPKHTRSSQVSRPESSKQTKTNESFPRSSEAAARSHLALTFKASLLMILTVLCTWKTHGSFEPATRYDPPASLWTDNSILQAAVWFVLLQAARVLSVFPRSSSLYPSLFINFPATVLSFVICCCTTFILSLCCIPWDHSAS